MTRLIAICAVIAGWALTAGSIAADDAPSAKVPELKALDNYVGSTLMTYDPARKVYRSWTVLSDGSTAESEGTWDAKARVMTSVGRKDEKGGFSTTTADFSEGRGRDVENGVHRRERQARERDGREEYAQEAVAGRPNIYMASPVK